MDQHVRVRPAEPLFDVPPRFGGAADRRLAGRAAARWTALRGTAAMPSAGRYAADEDVLADDASHHLVLDLSDPRRTVVDHAGSEVARVFGVTAGPVADAGPMSLAQAILGAVAVARQRPALVPFEALLRGRGHATATFLTRAVLLPLADGAGRLMAAHVVVSWKETLSPAANHALERELRLILTECAGERRLKASLRPRIAPVCH